MATRTYYNSTLGTTYHINKIWYAVMRDNTDSDWGFGSANYDDALRMLKSYLVNDPTAYIAVIDSSSDDPVCIDELHFAPKET